jgi:Leucine-rich repeat (LRR) protein
MQAKPREVPIESMVQFACQLNHINPVHVLRHRDSLVHYWSNVCPGLGRKGFEALGKCKRLRTAMLWGSDVRDEDLEHLGKIRSLEDVQLGRNPSITGATLDQLAGWQKVHTLSLYGNPITDESLANLPELPSLRSILLSSTKITGAGLTRLKDLPSLEFVELDKTVVNDTTILQLMDCKKLNRLSATDTGVTRDGLAPLFERFPKFKADTTKLPQPDTTDSDAATPTEPTLSEREVAERILMLGGQVEILITGRRQVVKAGDGLPAESFLVVSCTLPAKEPKSSDVLMLKDLTRLTELNLAFSGLRDEDLLILQHLPTIEYLKIGFLAPLDELTDEGLRTIAESESLKEIGIGNAPNITGDGLSHLAGNQSIRSVTIYSNPHLTGQDFRQLTMLGKLAKVNLLHQPEHPLPPTKIDALNGIPELYFHDCKLDDSSIDSLCNLSGLTKVFFSHCTITERKEERLRSNLKGVNLTITNSRPE